MKLKYWLLIIAIILIGAYLLFNSDTVEYAELNDSPHVKGNLEASVSLVEFSDFECPACGYASNQLGAWLEAYTDKIKFEYRNYPLSSIHKYAFQAAEAAECAADQGYFWEYYDKLFANQQNLSKKDLALYASQIDKLDLELWQDCLDSDAKAKRVQDDLDEARRMGLSFTPTFILNGQVIDDWQKLPELIQALVEPLVPLQQEATTTQSYLRNARFST